MSNEAIFIDGDGEADWIKSLSWDLPEYGSKEFNDFLKSANITLRTFQNITSLQRCSSAWGD
jgi:hypothetical protein